MYNKHIYIYHIYIHVHIDIRYVYVYIYIYIYIHEHIYIYIWYPLKTYQFSRLAGICGVFLRIFELDNLET